MIPLLEAQATGRQIQVLVDNMVSTFPDTCPRAHAVIACLTLAIILIKENVTPDEIQFGVKGASEWLCLYLTSPSESDKGKAN